MGELNEKLDILLKAKSLNSNKIMKAALKEVVPTYVNGDGKNDGGGSQKPNPERKPKRKEGKK